MQKNGLIAIVKRDCPTCVRVTPVLQEILQTNDLKIYSQDDPNFPDGVDGVADDTTLDVSYNLDIEIVPTLVRFVDGKEIDRTYGWDRTAWEKITDQIGRENQIKLYKASLGL